MTLRTPHLAVAAALFALLVVGVGVLAYVALRHPPAAAGVASPVQQPVPVRSAAPAPTPPAPAPAPVAAAPPGTAALPQPPSPAVMTAARPAAPAQPRVLTTQPADAGRLEIPGAPKPGVGGPGAPKLREGGVNTPLISVPAARPGGVNHPLMRFSEVRVLVADGSKSQEQDVSLNLESGGIVVRDGKDDQIVKALPYQSVVSATYSESKRPQWKAASGVAGVPSAFGGSGSLLQRASHWLTLQSKDDFLILRLEKDSVAKILLAIESRTRVHVQTVNTP